MRLLGVACLLVFSCPTDPYPCDLRSERPRAVVIEVTGDLVKETVDTVCVSLPREAG